MNLENSLIFYAILVAATFVAVFNCLKMKRRSALLVALTVGWISLLYIFGPNKVDTRRSMGNSESLYIFIVSITPVIMLIALVMYIFNDVQEKIHQCKI